MADKIELFGQQLRTPRALQARAPPYVPGIGAPSPGVHSFIAAAVVVTLVASGLGLVYLLEADETYNPGPPDGYENIITPLLSERVRTSADLQTIDSCGQLETELKAHIREEMLVDLATQPYWYWRGGFAWEDGPVATFDDAEAAPQAGATEKSGNSEPVEGEDYSGTNNQEQGVDEADFVKTDGKNIYLINGRILYLLGVPEFGQLTYLAEMELEGWPTEMLLANDYLVIFSSVYGNYLANGDPLRDLLVTDEENNWWRSTSLTKISVIDVADKAEPKLVRELYLEGYYKTAREVDGSVRMVSYGYLETPGLLYYPVLPDYYSQMDDESARYAVWNESILEAVAHNEQVIEGYTLEDLVPRIYERQEGAVAVHPFTDSACSDFIMAADATSHGFTSILTLDLFSDSFAYDADHIMSNWAQVYASTEMLVIAEQAQDWWWFWGNSDFEEATNLHAFDIATPGQTHYVGSGRVEGLVNDQFSLSEYQGYLRVATTSGQWGRWWMTESEQQGPENHVWVMVPATTFDGEGYLAKVGHVGGIAIGERIWSARFIGEKGYLVTFRNMDPLWTIDLSVPTDPKIMGELEVPGVSTYIHPLDEDHLLTIGLGPGDDGLGLDWSVTQLSQFNVTNSSNPQLASTLPLSPVAGDNGEAGWSYSYSEATYEHKAFQYWAPKGLLAVPLSTYRYYWDDDYRYRTWEYVSKLMLINVTAGQPLETYAEIDHSGFYDDGSEWWYNTNIRRSIFMGDYIYAVSGGGVTVHNLDTLELATSLELSPGREYRPIYYAESDEKVEG